MTHQMRALVADDDQTQRDSVGLTLMRLGFHPDNVHIATNFDEARELLLENRYDIIVSDNNMDTGALEGNHGLHLLLDIRSLSDSTLNVETPFILHTGDDTDIVKKRVKEYGGIYCYKGARTLTKILKEILDPKKAKAA